MKARRQVYSVILTILFFSFFLNSSTIYSQKKENKKKTPVPQKVQEFPISTTSKEALKLYIEARNTAENLKLTEAVSLYEKAIQLDNEFGLAYVGHAFSCGDYNTAIKDMEKSIECINKITQEEKHFILYHKALLEGNTARQRDATNKLISMYPFDKRILILAGNLEYASGNFNEALPHYQKAAEVDKNFPPVFNMLGYTYSGLNDFARAEDAFKKYISLVPKSPNPYDSYAELLMRNGKYDESISQYQKALDVDPLFITSIIGIGDNNCFKGDFAKAREYYKTGYDKATLINFKFTALYHKLVSFARENNISETLKSLEEAVALAEKENVIPFLCQSLLMKGEILAETGRPDEALKFMGSVIEKAGSSSLPNDLKRNLTAQARINRARAMIMQGRFDEASVELENKDQITCSLETPQIEKLYQFTMGLLNFKRDNPDKAIEHFSKADSQNPVNWYYSALAYEKKGDNPKARELMDKIKASNQFTLDLALVRNHVTEVAQKK